MLFKICRCIRTNHLVISVDVSFIKKKDNRLYKNIILQTQFILQNRIFVKEYAVGTIDFCWMIASRRDTSNIFSGCLSYLKSNLTAKLYENQTLISEGIKGIVGSETQYNVHNNPYNKAPAYIEIHFGNKYIVPTAYSLMGRRDSRFLHSYLKSWNFSGKDTSGKWILLHNETNKAFSFAENRTFPLKSSETFSAFKIQMTDKNTDGSWAICLGQIEVFGDIYIHPVNCPKCTKFIARNKLKIIQALIIIIEAT